MNSLTHSTTSKMNKCKKNEDIIFLNGNAQKTVSDCYYCGQIYTNDSNPKVPQGPLFLKAIKHEANETSHPSQPSNCVIPKDYNI